MKSKIPRWTNLNACIVTLMVAFLLLMPGDSSGQEPNCTQFTTVGSPVQLTFNSADDGEPSWSPDGTMIAFASYRTGNQEIYIIDLAAGTDAPVTSNGNRNWHPDWSPDGQLISYTGGPNSDQIWVSAPDGSGETAITTSGPHRHPDWSPDGSEFAYTAIIGVEGPVRRINSDGSGTPSTVVSSGWYADWSPDGSRIAFARYAGGGQIYLVDPDGSNLKNISTSSDYHAYPAWSPDGSTIACSITKSGNSEIYIIDTLGNELLQVTNSPSSDVYPTWSPLGDAIAFHSNRSGNADIWKVGIACEGANILVYITWDPSCSYPCCCYPMTFFDEGLAQVLGLDGHSVTLTDRVTTPVITSGLLANYDQFWFLSTAETHDVVLSPSETDAIFQFRNQGGGLFVAADNAPHYTWTANQIALPLGVQFYGSVDHAPEFTCLSPAFDNHPLFAGVSELLLGRNEGAMSVTSPADVIATYNGNNVTAILDDGLGRCVFDVSFVRIFDSQIMTCDNAQYFQNIADWLQEGESPSYSNLRLGAVPVSPETPTAFEDASLSVRITNTGTGRWEFRRLLLGVVCDDIEDIGKDGILLDLLPQYNVQQRYFDFVDLGDIGDLEPGEVFTGTYTMSFKVPDYIDKVCYYLEPVDDDEQIDDVDDGVPEFCHPLNVNHNEQYTLLNCLGTILTFFAHTSFDADDFAIVKQMHKSAVLGLSDPPDEQKFITAARAGHMGRAITEFLDYLKWYLNYLSWQARLVGVDLPVLSHLSAIYNELRGAGCAGIISHRLALLLSFDLDLLFEDVFPGLILWTSASPVEISVACGEDTVFVTASGEVSGHLEGSFGHEFNDVKALMLTNDESQCDLLFNGYSSGHADFVMFNSSIDGSSIWFYNDVVVTESSSGYIGMYGESVDPPVLHMDEDGDGVIDLDILPFRLDKTTREGFICGKISIAGLEPAENVPVVSIDLADSLGDCVGSVNSDEYGKYVFQPLLPGRYMVSISTPLGYSCSEEVKEVEVFGLDPEANFELTELEITPTQRSMGYWKHQVNVHLSGKGQAQESLADMSSHMGLIGEHFNNNLANPITIFEVAQPATQTDSVEVLKDLLTVKGNAGMNAKARQQLIALLLNVASLKLHQAALISEDSATVSQAITCCNQLIMDSDPDNDEIAKDIADDINNGILVASGVIPLSTPNIAYKGRGEESVQNENILRQFSLAQNYPNPFNPDCQISYALPADAEINLSIYNVLGQKVRTLVDEHQAAGRKTVSWDGTDERGNRAASGVYFYRIQAGEFEDTKKMILMK